jgi:hypothetical protein
MGIFRLWRDLGYAIGALMTGILADYFGILFAIIFIGLLTCLSAIIIKIRMRCGEGDSVKIWDWIVGKEVKSTCAHSHLIVQPLGKLAF